MLHYYWNLLCKKFCTQGLMILNALFDALFLSQGSNDPQCGHNRADDDPTTPEPEEAGGDIISHAESLPTCHDPIYDTVYDALIGFSLHITHCLCVLSGF
jgi:hypothetical protein